MLWRSTQQVRSSSSSSFRGRMWWLGRESRGGSLAASPPLLSSSSTLRAPNEARDSESSMFVVRRAAESVWARNRWQQHRKLWVARRRSPESPPKKHHTESQFVFRAVRVHTSIGISVRIARNIHALPHNRAEIDVFWESFQREPRIFVLLVLVRSNLHYICMCMLVRLVRRVRMSVLILCCAIFQLTLHNELRTNCVYMCSNWQWRQWRQCCRSYCSYLFIVCDQVGGWSVCLVMSE